MKWWFHSKAHRNKCALHCGIPYQNPANTEQMRPLRATSSCHVPRVCAHLVPYWATLFPFPLRGMEKGTFPPPPTWYHVRPPVGATRCARVRVHRLSFSEGDLRAHGTARGSRVVPRANRTMRAHVRHIGGHVGSGRWMWPEGATNAGFWLGFDLKAQLKSKFIPVAFVVVR